MGDVWGNEVLDMRFINSKCMGIGFVDCLLVDGVDGVAQLENDRKRLTEGAFLQRKLCGFWRSCQMCQ